MHEKDHRIRWERQVPRSYNFYFSYPLVKLAAMKWELYVVYTIPVYGVHKAKENSLWAYRRYLLLLRFVLCDCTRCFALYSYKAKRPKRHRLNYIHTQVYGHTCTHCQTDPHTCTIVGILLLRNRTKTHTISQFEHMDFFSVMHYSFWQSHDEAI